MSRNNQSLDYKTILGLQKDPFSAEPDPLSYFPVVSFEQRLTLLKGLVQGADILVLVIGESGGGKTTLLKRYLNTTDKMWAPGRIQTSPAPDQTPDSKARDSHPAYVLLDSEDPVVIVDDAHLLSADNLMFLLREALVPGSTQMIKRLILFGESGLYTEMTSLTESFIGETSVNKIYLPALTMEEAAAYLEHRLKVAGYTGKKLFNSSIVKKIHQASGGIPGPMNEIADQWLKENYTNKKKRRDILDTPKARPRGVFGWIGAGIVVILLAVLVLFVYRQTQVSRSEDPQIAQNIFRAKIAQKPEATGKIFRATISQKPETTGKIFRAKISAVNPSITPPIKTSAKPVVVKKIEPPQFSVAQTEKTDLPQKIQKHAPPTQTQKIKPIQKTELQTASAQPTKKIASLEKTEGRKEEAPTQPAATSKVTEVVTEKAAKKSIHREDWLLSINAEHYTIQIMGVSNEDSLLYFIKKDQLLDQNRLAYYKAAYKKKNWYPLLYGVYATKKEARLAANELPARFREASPWIRKISTVQKEIQLD